MISVGYRVNSKKGIAFRKWSSSVLKDYMIKVYVYNEKRLKDLGMVLKDRRRKEIRK
jgi:hypothetical protein